MIQNDDMLNKTLTEEISSVNEYMRHMLQSDNHQMQEVMDWVLAVKGKQLRPKILLVSAKFGSKEKNVIEFAAIVEIMHMASLIHDDVIDDADTRRGRLSVQKKFGKNMAVYAGDFMIFSVFAKNQLQYDRQLKKLFPTLNNICYGELGQNSNLYNLDITVDDYIRNITGKTASMFELACESGALISGANEKKQKSLSDFGRNFGILFQIHDDLLDFGLEKEKIDKPIYQDFVNGIYTLPVLYSIETPGQKDLFRKIQKQIKKDNLNVEICRHLTESIQNADGFEKCRLKAREYYVSAMEDLENLPNGAERRYLQNLLDTVYNAICQNFVC